MTGVEFGFQQSPILHKKPAKHGPQSILLLTNVTMSEPVPRLPPEVVDDIIELLHDDRIALHRCCLVLKSWIPRARSHLFTKIKLDKKSSPKAWGELFPDPTKSPAGHVRTLFISGVDFQVEGAEESGWIQSFIKVTHFIVYGIKNAKLKFFHNFSPALKSLHVSSDSGPLSDILALACSFPLLEDLKYRNFQPIKSIDQGGAAFQPLSSPAFNGTLTLEGYWLEAITIQMLNLSCGLHFKKIVWRVHYTEHEGPEFWWMRELVKSCSHALEYIDIGFYLPRKPHLSHSVTGSVSDPDFLLCQFICQEFQLTCLK